MLSCLLGNARTALFLKMDFADLCLPIFISSAEADSITVNLSVLSVPRPTTHDLLRALIDTFGGSVKHVVVSYVHNRMAYAKIVLQAGSNLKELDSRPGDAVALAVGAGVPIYAEEWVLDEAGWGLDQETGALMPLNYGREQHRERTDEIEEEELRRMSAFAETIATLGLEDIGAGQPINSLDNWPVRKGV